MEYGKFIEDGRKYEIHTPLTPTPWSNCLYNEEYYMEVSQTLQGAGYMVEDYNRTPCLSGYRYFYLLDMESKEVWNPNYVPLCRQPDTYSCTHGIWMSELTSAQQGIQTNIQVLVPPAGSREVWIVKLHNQGRQARDIACYTVFGFYDHGVMGGECTYDEGSQIIFKHAFPYHTLYEEKEKVQQQKAYYYLFSDKAPQSCEMSRRRFFGASGEYGIPEGVRKEKLSGIPGEAEDFCGAFSHVFRLEPEETVCFYLEAGAAVTKEEVIARKGQFSRDRVDGIKKDTDGYWKESFDRFIMKTPDENLNAFGNYWLKKQIILLTKQNRGGSYCPVRNQLQDAMGLSMIDPEGAEKYIAAVMKLQQKNGFLQQWHDTAGAPPRGLCLLHHTDGPVWLVICTEVYIRQRGDRSILDKRIPYADGGEGTVLEHLKAALFYLLDHLGAHGMCLMGDGDWNDPINGVGRLGKGESVWLSMALVYGIHVLMPYLQESDPESYEKLRVSGERMQEAINKYGWSKKWYAAAIHDDGKQIGDDKDRLFLNTQSWAILSGVAEGERTELLMDTLSRMETPFGPLILDTPFDEWDARWGRISVKKSGTTENGSVYCHASMFLAYAQAMRKDGDSLYEILWRTLPTNPENAPDKNLQLPVYLANYYYGLKDSPNFGRSSLHYGTGTVAWMLMLLIEAVAGVEATVDGLTVHPCLPAEWKEITCKRKYKNAEYYFTMKRGGTAALMVDGVLYEKKTLPYEENKVYQVEVIVE